MTLAYMCQEIRDTNKEIYNWNKTVNNRYYSKDHYITVTLIIS